MKIIAGLGNPEKKYDATRHNAGFEVLDILAKKLGVATGQKQKNALCAVTQYNGERMILAKPQTYMNLSGESVGPLADYYKAAPEDVIVIVDDINLPVGCIRIRGGGSAGGHNGLKSIIAHLGTEEFPRIRVGVGAAKEDLISHVLGKVTGPERTILNKAEELAAEAALVICEKGINEAMNRFNGVRVESEQ